MYVDATIFLYKKSDSKNIHFNNFNTFNILNLFSKCKLVPYTK